MRSRVLGMIVMVAVFMTLGLREAQSQRIITATETTGLSPDLSTLTDSVFGVICGPTNEDATACNFPPNQINYSVPSTLINPNLVMNGGSFGVNMWNDPSHTILSDQLYLLVGPQVGGMNLLTWCWDSDREPNVNICQRVINPQTLKDIDEPAFGTMNLTGLFTGTDGPLAPGQWSVTALSESPEPSTWLLLATGLGGLRGYVQLRRKKAA
jgi:hypothetical protein